MRKLPIALLTALSLFVAAPALAQTTPPAKGAPAAKSTPAPAKTEALIDINSAAKPDLEALKGIGPARAEAIIKGRPYKGKDELLEKKIVPKNVYDDIKDKIIARQKT